jgi:hypothetical protein
MLVIYNFLALLEMLQQKIARIFIGEGFNNFWIELNPETQEAAV